jgi:DNA-binding SARP family transcriptional activator/tetratricopeptide (TPR) repeat protein
MRFRILGPVEIHGPGGQARLGGGRPVALLAVLMLQANRTVSYERLISAVWGNDPPVYTTAALQTYISRLRKALAEVEPYGPERIITYKTGYLLRVRPGELDLEQFREHVQRGRSAAAAGRLTDAITEFSTGLGLWRGSALNGMPGELEQQMASLDESYVAAAEQHIECRLALGEHDQVMLEIDALVAAHPLRERLRELAMLALYRSGRQADSLAVYQETHRLLVDELGIEPGPSLRELHRRILAADSGLLLPAPRVAGPVPRQLPSDVANFTGRAGYMERLNMLLPGDREGPGGPVVISAIEGIAGVGKTALALHWAHRAAARMPDGQLYVNLRGYAQSPPMEPSEALAWFLRALGVPQEQIPVAQDEQAALYRSLVADKRILVVLDNAATAEQVRPLLPGTSTCLVLITSRSDLRGLVALDGARRLVLDVLPPKEAVDLLTRTIGDDRVTAGADTLAELARLCDYLPLALRIAAANLAGHPSQTIAGYLAQLTEGDRLSELGIEQDQQAAVRASFDLSYRTLSPEAARLFRLLGLVPGPDFATYAAAIVAAIPQEQATQLLDALAAAYLIERHAPDRFQFHDLIRLYAAERAHREDSEQDRADALRRLFLFYLHTADSGAHILYPEIASLLDSVADPGVRPLTFDDRGQAFGWLDSELANMVAVVRHATRHGPHALAWHLAYALRGYFYIRMNGADWLETADLGLRAADLCDDVAGRMAMLHDHAHARFTLGDFEKSLDYATRALPLSRQLGDRRAEAENGKWSGLSCWLLGRLEQSAEYLTKALELYRETGNVHGEANVHIGLGILYDDMGEWDKALYHDDRALVLNRKIGSKYGEALAMHCFGMVYGQLGRFAEASDLHARTLALYKQVGSRYHEPSSTYSSAVTHRDAGRYEQALADAEQSLALSRETGDSRTEANALNTLGTTRHLLGRHEDAVAYHDLAVALAKRTSFRRAEVEAHIGLAAAHSGLGRYDQARTHGQVALRSARECGFRWCEGNALVALADTDLGDGQYDHAVKHAQEGLALHRAIKHRLGEARALRTLGHAVSKRDSVRAALPHWQDALAILTDLGTPEAERVRVLIGAVTPG